ncbi:MAG: gamma-glutamyltransferase [Melioribacteraceae bacterium]|nr:gamma-glutamyltransferase [Melioribacteraceae bacterium]
MLNKLFIIVFILIAMIDTITQDRPAGKLFATRSEIIARNGIAATSHPLATQVALDILKKGGTAVDAAIAANAMLGLVEPMSCGIGGDLFAIVWDASSKKLFGLNASGRSPRALTLQILKSKGLDKIPLHGPLPVSVPGCVDGWFELHDKFGRLKFAELMSPAIYYAEKGFPVTEVIAGGWKSAEYLKEQPGFEKTFLPGGNAPDKGEIFTNPDLANSYRLIAEGGRRAFYNDSIAEKIVGFLSEHGGYLSLMDFASHQSEWVQPESTNYRGYDVWELPPNGQGIAVLQMLNILEGYDIKNMGFGSTEYLHLLIETKKIVYEDRAKFYGDPSFNNIPVNELISKKYADKRRELIDELKASDTFDAGKLEHGDTIYLTVADSAGNMVSLIQSNYWGFGSGMVPDGLGFSLQNRGELFTFEEGHFNQYEPGKRPFHTIIPGFVTKDGEPWLSFGVMGGAMQPQGHVQALINIIDFGMNFQEAGDAPRIRHFGSSQPTGSIMRDGGYIYAESGIRYEIIDELRKLGHKIEYMKGVYGGYQAIMRDGKRGIYYGASESRKDGQAAGY